jgi:hypothetical protein
MKNFALTLCAAALAVSAATSAMAQPGAWSLDARINAVQGGIDKAVADGALDRAQHDKVQFEMADIRKKKAIYAQTHGGQISPDAERNLEVDLDNVINSIQWHRQGEWRRPW